MADLFKVTFFLQYGRGGFSFSHYTQQDGYAICAQKAKRVAIAYLRCCGDGVQLTNIRVSRDDINGDSLVSNTSLSAFGIAGGNATMAATQVKTAINDKPDAWWTSALLRLGNSPSQYGHQFVRGIPDDQVVLNGGLVRGGPWEDAITEYIADLVTNGFGGKFVPRGVGTRKKILAMADNGAAGWTITTSVAHGLSPGHKFRIGGFKGGADAVVNQVWIADATPTGVTVVVGPMQSDFDAAAPVKSFGDLWTQEKSFAAYVAGFCGLVRVSERRAGRPSDVLVGRRLRKV